MMFTESFLEAHSKIGEVVDETKHDDADQFTVTRAVKSRKAVLVIGMEEGVKEDARNETDHENPETYTETDATEPVHPFPFIGEGVARLKF